MRSRASTGWCSLVLVWLAIGASGCASDFWGCDAVATCPPAMTIIGTTGATGAAGEAGSGGAGGGGGEGGGAVCPEDTIDGVVVDTCGVWVSAALGDDANPGTQEQPVRTLARGIELADPKNLGPARLYACGGEKAEYVEWVTLPSGISLYGGFDCQDGWRYVGWEKRAFLRAAATHPALTLTEGEHESMIRDLRVRSDDATEPGESAMAVMALPGSKADLRRMEIDAGDGADGLDGEDGSHNGVPAQKGLAGNDGMDACVADPGIGGAAVMALCDGPGSIGGAGGDGNAIAASDGADGWPGDLNLPEYGVGGNGEDAAQGTLCTGGAHGAHGNDGQHGKGAGSGLVGTLTKDGYFGVSGEDGQPGQPGQGGGGGGASLGAACGAAPFGGSGGGSGGSGGCGGKGGQGGRPGGSSIGIASLSNGISAEEITIRTGNGGKGGNGGAMQPGGQGGLPGYGGTGTGAGGAKNGCGGGIGGHGGSGGHGGGGHGGHSVAVAHVPGTGVKSPQLLTVIHGDEGLGGLGGDPDAAVGKAEGGDAGDSLVLNPG